ncbi:MAG: M20 family metallopeptidase [Verrucomicrobia bacterium]|nr:M20 family metallopeptidase [Verrucomicrobiota bacterium]
MNAADLLTQLVNFRTDQREAEQAAFLARLLESWGARVRLQEVAPDRPNLIATFDGRDATRSVMFEAHGDTVGGDAPFVASIRDGRLYGRGSCDTKGSMTAMLMGIREVLERDGGVPVTLHFVSTCDEELGAAGAHALMAVGFRADWALVGEPTGLQIVYAHKGAVRVTIRTSGIAAHSSTPERGVNAIYTMRALLERLERWQPTVRHPVLGAPTLSVGTIHGGSQVNVVPASCEIEVDRRLVPGESVEAAVAEMLGEWKAETEVTAFYPPLDGDLNGAAAEAMKSACRKVLGRAEFVVAPYASDAGVFQAAGIPSLLFGPGDAAQAHSRDEFIELDQITRAAQVYAAALGAS